MTIRKLGLGMFGCTLFLLVMALLLAGLIWKFWPKKSAAEPATQYASAQVITSAPAPSAATAPVPEPTPPAETADPPPVQSYPAQPSLLSSVLGTVASMTLKVYPISPDNPSFPLTSGGAHAAFVEMEKNPQQLPRPLVIIGGYEDPGILTTLGMQYFQLITKDTKLISISVANCRDFAECRARVLEEVNIACGNHDPNWTAEVDVIGISLGGLAARVAAAPSRDPATPQRLRIAHLYTLSSPLAGARVANLGITRFQQEIQPDSDLQKYLNAVDADPKYEITSYVHLGDEMVGQENASIPGRTPYWLPNTPLVPLLPHEQMMVDERALADIGRRLRGETPYTLPKPAPFPPIAEPVKN
ncbi:MAG TPA: hypothetical protein VK737_01770 [Opitutales bacterium]|nr:hypothetical protein [Opitutales bacterium]